MAQAESVVRLYLTGVELGQPATREQKEFIEGIIASDYDGRTVVELLQNGHDAHDADRTDGKLELFLDACEGEHGVLYVANEGSPLADRDFTSMCRVAMSSKRPDQGIGNKGVGFKSVLQLSESPEVYSAVHEGAGRFDGYRFRFARPADFDDLAASVAPDRVGLADELRENVATLKVPFPLPDVPPHVEAFAQRGFSTVVRLPIRSVHAMDRAKSELVELVSGDVPFHLFLERVGEILVWWRDADGSEDGQLLTRSIVPLPGVDDITVDEATVQDDTKFLVLRRTIPEPAITEAIKRSRIDGRLSSGWERWEGDGEVSVAVPLGQALPQGRLYTFLPMGPEACGPLPAFVNAPFFARLDRRSLNESLPLNSFLLNEVARLCADAITAACSGELDLPDEVLLDLTCWTAQALPRLKAALADHDVALEELPVLPALGSAGRVELNAGWLWNLSGTVFTAEAVAAAGVDELIRPDLGPERTARIKDLAAGLNIPIVPRQGELAEFAGLLAESFVDRKVGLAAWADLYDDLSAAVPDGKALSGRNVLIGEDGDLLVAGGDSGSRTVYFGRVHGEGTTGAGPLSAAVRDRLAFMPADVPWLNSDGRRRPGRGWLDAQNLVREYRTDALIEVVGQAMRGPEDDDSRKACLRFAFDVWRGAVREIAAEVMKQARLLLPTTSGWSEAGETYFGTGWEGPAADTDRLLARLVARGGQVSQPLADIASHTLVSPQEVLRSRVDGDDLLRFVELLGAQHGLAPRYFPARSFLSPGNSVANPRTAGHFNVAMSEADQARWREIADRWPKRQPTFFGVPYSPTTGVAVLPGQRDWDSFDDETRRWYAELVFRGLDTWPDKALEFHFGRSSDGVQVAWPTFIAAFLATVSWMPQTTPGQRTTVTLMPLSEAWMLRDAETPDYLRAQPAAFRNLATPRVLKRLAKVGARFWDDAASAAERLLELHELVHLHGVGTRGQLMTAVRKAYETAWRDLCKNGQPPPHTVVVSTQGRLALTDLNEGDEVVYACEEDGTAQERLLRQAPVPVLAIRDRRLARRVRTLLQDKGISRLQSTAAASIEVLVDGVSAATAPCRPLHEVGGDWLPLLVLAVMEFQYQGFASVSAEQLSEAARRLDAVTVVVADSVNTVVDGHHVDDRSGPRSFLLVSDASARAVVAGVDGARPWAVVQASSAALAELIEMPLIADSIRLALLDLQRECGDRTPTRNDLARTLRIALDDLEGLALQSSAARSDVSAVVAVLACIDIAVAEELQGISAPFTTRDELHSWLSERTEKAEAVLELAEKGDLLEATLYLNVDLSAANAGLRAMGLPALHNAAGHQRQFDAYVQQHRAELLDRLRDRFIPTARHGESLADYLRLRDLPGLRPDDAWLDGFWDVPADLPGRQMDAWLDEVCPQNENVQEALPPVNDLRDAGRRTITSVIGNVRVLVEAWLHRNSGGEGPRPGDAGTVVEAMTSAGRLDFGRLKPHDVLAWLRAHTRWPAAMPLTTSRADLSLSEQDIADAAVRLQKDRDFRHREATYVRYGAHTFSDEPADLMKLIEEVRRDIPDTALAVAASPTTLLVAPAAGGASQPGGRRIGSWRATSAPPEKLRTIGLAGEAFVAEWLRHRFGLPPEDTWESGFRADVFADGRGDDSLGYDFRVATPETTWLFEVKSTTDDVPQLALGESEVRRAGDLAPYEQYLIVFVTHVLDPARRRIHVLPNPLEPGGMRYYRVAGRSMRLQFDLGD
ncbi:sacsin N-terminal ATP-binding-like domain-containing protein [Lentzea cavernae]|uniref:Protein NO VEIN C-terminal domain-containing protein n=1 Tax=Lentzea cavernae TaxID=2020703 RepID=A0ABQ3MEC2_9PSEU|nr:hypothetical protein [Lentzea cavernae]GHH42180.1 hypothetical protein GCM10017774_38060 [Lentzea cavernae]